ncbi:hypothetical protein ANCCAN_12702 [Ancylostoma caninum]|uniref:Uncharacterized protein n=1 Tax=Ancylostoma caninum TaxID=29170 RepID=A0A368GDI4_ANCCA|nr:hypothetical protein ANCCAN_12702 [Ancylostoma caninum]
MTWSSILADTTILVHTLVLDAPDTPHTGASTMVGSLFGNTCFKACGMEDIQYAARSAGDMLIALRFCILATTVIFLICLVILTGAILYTVCRKVGR